MSLLTQCPACSTLYRVVPDQLRISEGWVKCGQCSEIFDASRHLLEADVVALEQSPMDVLQPPAPMREELAKASTESAPTGVAMPEFDVSAESTPDAIVEAMSEAPLQMRWDDPADGGDVVSVAEEVPEAGALNASFMAPDSSGQFWRGAWIRGAMFLLVFLLSLSLIGQWLMLERNRLAAQHPQLKVVLGFFCDLSKCSVDPLQRIESLSVDSVVFNPLGKDSYRLSFVVKNSSDLALAMPALELSLTDAQDNVVYRRILKVEELSADDGKVIAGGSERTVSLALRAEKQNEDTRVVGYRVLIFYP